MTRETLPAEPSPIGMDQFRAAIDRYADNPQGNESVLRAHGEAVRELLDGPETTMPHFHETMDFVTSSRKDISPDALVQVFRVACQDALVGWDKHAYPEEYASREVWTEALRHLFENRESREWMTYRLLTQTIQTNEPRRAYGLSFLLGLNERTRLESALDVGGAAGLTPAEVQLKILKDPPIVQVPEKHRRHKAVLESAVRALFDSEVSIEHSWNIDKRLPLPRHRDGRKHDERYDTWIENSVYPSELNNPEIQAARAQLKNFLDTHRGRMQAFNGDILSPDDRESLASRSQYEQYDLVNAMTVMYMLPGRERHNGLRLLQNWTAPGGITYLQDFIRPSQSPVHRPAFVGLGGQYSSWQYLPEGGGYTMIGVFDGGRCREFEPSDYTVAKLLGNTAFLKRLAD